MLFIAYDSATGAQLYAGTTIEHALDCCDRLRCCGYLRTPESRIVVVDATGNPYLADHFVPLRQAILGRPVVFQGMDARLDCH